MFGALPGISGLLIHALCAADASALARLIALVEDRMDDVLRQVDWVNLGGGHLLGQDGYDVEQLCRLVSEFQRRHGVRVILEPGEGVVSGVGYLLCRVLDIVRNEKEIAVLDVSAANHIPCLLENPVGLEIAGTTAPGPDAYEYRLAGITCLSTDVLGDCWFPAPLRPGDRLVLRDTAHYTTVRSTMFNGVAPPSIALFSRASGACLVRSFSFEDYESGLG